MNCKSRRTKLGFLQLKPSFVRTVVLVIVLMMLSSVSLAKAVVCCVNKDSGCTNITDDSTFIQNACISPEVGGHIINSNCSTVPECVPPTEDDFVSKGLKGITGLLGIFGQGAGVSEGPQEPEVVVGKIILGFLLVIGVVFGILVIYGGYLWMTARGNEEQAKKAIGILETTIIGFIIVVGAYAITSFVVDRVITAAFPPSSP